MAKRKKRDDKKVILDYDDQETSEFINSSESLKFESIGLRLPKIPPTQVVSIRLPSELLNELKALGSQRDVPYQALIKLFLAESVKGQRKKMAYKE